MRNFARYLIDAIGNRFTTSDFATASSVSGKANLVTGIHPANESRGSALSYNATTGEITLTGANGQTSLVNLPVELLLQSASYNSTTKTLTLTTNGGATVEVPLTDLVDLPEIQIATQNPVANPTTGQRVYFRSDTSEYWLAVSGIWQGPHGVASNHTHSQYGDKGQANTWTEEQTFNQAFAKKLRLEIVTRTTPGAWPAGTTMVVANLPSESVSIDCTMLGHATQTPCLAAGCLWSTDACNGNSQVSCEAVLGCTWEMLYCEDFLSQGPCDAELSCSWDSGNDVCTGGLYSDSCIGTPTNIDCYGTVYNYAPMGFETEDNFADKQFGVLRNVGAAAIYLTFDSALQITVPPASRVQFVRFANSLIQIGQT